MPCFNFGIVATPFLKFIFVKIISSLRNSLEGIISDGNEKLSNEASDRLNICPIPVSSRPPTQHGILFFWQRLCIFIALTYPPTRAGFIFIILQLLSLIAFLVVLTQTQ